MNKFVCFLVSMAKVLVRPFYPVEFVGPRKFEQKRTLLVGNHISGWDPVVFTLWSKTNVSFAYKAELGKSPFLRWIFDGLDMVPVRRGEVDLNSTKSILRLLHNDRIVGLFPEGTRNPQVDCLQDFHTGAALFALKTRSPVRPFYIWEKTRIFHKNYIIVGDEFTLEEFYDQPISKDLLQRATAVIKQRVDELRVQLNGILEKRGVKRRPRTKKEIDRIVAYNNRQKKFPPASVQTSQTAEPQLQTEDSPEPQPDTSTPTLPVAATDGSVSQNTVKTADTEPVEDKQ